MIDMDRQKKHKTRGGLGVAKKKRKDELMMNTVLMCLQTLF
jgi:hypothetical protein